MNELVDLIVKKTGIPDATAQVVVITVMDYLKKKLPTPVGTQIEVLLNNQGAGKIARTAKHRANDVV